MSAPGSGSAGTIERVVVVVPARDEEELLPRCLAALGRATAAVARDRPGVRVAVVVVLDGCTDGSARVARAAGVRVVEVAHGNVGRARRAGVRAGVAALGVRRDRADARTWLACTDADSAVPEHWLTRQLDLADAGADVVVGTVRPELAALSPDRARAWLATHRPGHANGHVHGANLGVRLTAHDAAGGFAPVAEHEDVGLVERARAAGARIVADASAEVLTSARLVGRTPGGYARHLREDLLAHDLPA
ncbi:glycosyltransferase [Cellulosimicrobium cellulans]|uniref:glycosyltransferase n=1 Tax=Cellulosimicrobium cellulans TaxID=1710 RepID=UPI00214A67C2|nr:glycosyltransferase [Cellulosimicrobium cellulans]